MLIAAGENVMLGYLGRPDHTAEAIRDVWYMTGDIAMMDEKGLMRRTVRMSRFSKIGGEMVPHVKVEEAISNHLGTAACTVTAVPDDRRGEKLIAYYASNGIMRDELWERLNQSELPKLWLPKREDLQQIESIP